jgi:hypothetical protein
MQQQVKELLAPLLEQHSHLCFVKVRVSHQQLLQHNGCTSASCRCWQASVIGHVAAVRHTAAVNDQRKQQQQQTAPVVELLCISAFFRGSSSSKYNFLP